MKILVTGGNGFIGTFLIEELLKSGHQIRCLVLHGESLRELKDLPVEIVYGNIRDINTLYDPVVDVDKIFHLAGLINTWDADAYFLTNFQGTKNLLDAALLKNRRIDRFIYISSQAAAGASPDGRPLTEADPCNPIDSYGKSKLAAEGYLRRYFEDIPITIIRPVPSYGPSERCLFTLRFLCKVTRLGFAPLISPGDTLLNLLHVRDLVRGILMAAETEAAHNQTYFLTSQRAYSSREIIKTLFAVRNKRGWIISLPKATITVGASIYQFLRMIMGQPFDLIHETRTKFFQKYWVCSGDKARRELGFEPIISLREGFEELVKWYDDTYRIHRR